MGYLTMNRKEREQAKVFEQIKLEAISQVEAAAKLGITDRWVRVKIKRYYEDGDAGLIHKLRGQKSLRSWNEDEKKLLIALLQNEWHGFGPTFAREKLEEVYSIKVSTEVVRQTMIKEGLWKQKERRLKHRKRRERKPMLGMMIQLDGSPHDWFEGRAGKCTLLVFIDDATSKILWLEFAESESVMSLMQSTKNYVKKHGIPNLFYTDHGSVFHVNLNNAEDDKKTQWEQAVAQLGIQVQHAHSPQAKGRVERCNQTMQDRLIQELRLAKVSSIDAANDYLKSSNFIANHNQKYAVDPYRKGDAHRTSESYNLETIFSINEARILANDYTITYDKQIFQLHKEQKTIIRPKNEITVKTLLNGSIQLWIRQIELAYSLISKQVSKPSKEKQSPCYKPYKPSINSRRWVAGLAPLSSPESRHEAGLAAAEQVK